MSFVDVDQMSASDLVATYILECRGRGICLAYHEYQLVSEWLVACGDVDQLLLILSDILPDYFSPSTTGRRKSLQGVHRLVMSRVRDRAMTQGERRPRSPHEH